MVYGIGRKFQENNFINNKFHNGGFCYTQNASQFFRCKNDACSHLVLKLD